MGFGRIMAGWRQRFSLSLSVYSITKRLPFLVDSIHLLRRSSNFLRSGAKPCLIIFIIIDEAGFFFFFYRSVLFLGLAAYPEYGVDSHLEAATSITGAEQFSGCHPQDFCLQPCSYLRFVAPRLCSVAS